MGECLSPEAIESYARKQLSGTERDRADRHLETCDRCVEALLEIELAGAGTTPAAAAATASPGPRIGPYACLRELGRGGQGQVYLAEDTRLGRRVALKVLSPYLAPSPEVRLRFQREAAALSRLDHPNICTVYEVGEVDGAAYIAMRYIEGETLARRIAGEALERQQGKTATREEVLRLALLIERAASALHAAHEAGLVHRDVKPGNIVVARDGEPVLLDFGLVGEEQSLHTLTRTGELMGTPAYMSPEQVRGERAIVDRRSDVYSLGVTLYEALTLRLPFDAPTVPAVCRQILTESAPDPRRHNRHITPDLKAILETAMEPDRSRRYRTALDFAADLHRFQAGETVLARPAGPMVKLRRWTQRNRAATVAGLVVILSLSIALGLTVTFLRKAERDRDDKAAALVREEAARLALHSANVLPANPGQALILAIESVERRPTAAGYNALLAAIDDCRERWRLFGHKSEIDDVDFGPDGRRVITASRGGSARIWSAETGESLRLLEGHNQSLVSARFSPDGATVLTAGLDAAARLWDVESGKELRALRGHEHGLQLAIFSPDGAQVLTVGRTSAKLWHAAAGELLATLGSGNSLVTCAAFSPQGERIAIGEADGSAGIWDGKTMARTAILRGHEQPLRHLAFSGDGRRILTGADDATARLWDAASGEQAFVLAGHGGPLRFAVFAAGGRRVVTGAQENKFWLWDAATGKGLFALSGHSEKVTGLRVSRDGKRLLSISIDRTARVWDAETGYVIAVLGGHAAPLLCAAFSPDGDRAITGAADHTARVWCVEPPGKLHAIGEPPITSLMSLRLSPDGRRIVAGTRVKEASVWDVETGAETVRLIGHQDAVFHLDFTRDGSRVVTASADGTARVWDPATGRQILALLGHTGAVNTAVLSPGGDRILTASADWTARLWDAASGACLRVLEGHAGAVAEVVFRPDGRQAATSSRNDGARLWDLESGAQVLTLGESPGPVLGIDWSRDGRTLLTLEPHSVTFWDAAAGSKRSSFTLWRARAQAARLSPDGERAFLLSESTRALVLEVASAQIVASLVHPDVCNRAAWSADGQLLATASEDAKLRIWSTATWEIVMEPRQDHGIGHVEFSGDGRFILTLDNDRPRLWPLELLRRAKQLRPGELTPDERDRFEVGSPGERTIQRQAWQGGEIFGEAAR